MRITFLTHSIAHFAIQPPTLITFSQYSFTFSILLP